MQPGNRRLSAKLKAQSPGLQIITAVNGDRKQELSCEQGTVEAWTLLTSPFSRNQDPQALPMSQSSSSAPQPVIFYHLQTSYYRLLILLLLLFCTLLSPLLNSDLKIRQ